ncbi:hypothetical protein ACFU6K_00695 [Kitasatospora sp. NPDC057512]|uniref:hypothetical protein n=1 Tax=Kitasatospora sp. NPDC057512 TaxID=3346154 RepID=UPI003680FBA6
MIDQPTTDELRLDIPRIRRRAADCGLSDDDLTQITGIKPSHFEGQLDLHTLSAARLLHLAAALDTAPQNLLQDAPEPEPTTPPIPPRSMRHSWTALATNPVHSPQPSAGNPAVCGAPSVSCTAISRTRPPAPNGSNALTSPSNSLAHPVY